MLIEINFHIFVTNITVNKIIFLVVKRMLKK